MANGVPRTGRIKDAIYILNVRPSENREAVESCGKEFRNYFKGRRVNFTDSQVNIDHYYELVQGGKVLSKEKKRGAPYGRSHIEPLAGRNDVSFSSRDVSAYLKEHLSEREIEKRLKEIWNRGKEKIRERHGTKVTTYTNHLFTKSNCKCMLAGDLGIYKTEKRPTWMIQFLARNPGRQVDGFVEFLNGFEVGDAGYLSEYSQLYVETGISCVYKRVL
jgi:hypothetical protein